THGDGSIFSDTAGGGLNRQDALGKVLRINPLQSAGSPYTTPNNPFVSDPNTLDEIYTLGHRNPHHISFAQDSQGNSYAIVAEAGRDNIEEVNLLQPGGNYGWEDREGTFVHLNGGGYIDGVSALPANEWALNDYIYPVAQYDHDTTAGAGFVGSVIGGGFVIDNSVDPNLNGEYFFADFGSKSGHMYHADFSEMLAAHTQLADNELPSALTQATIYRAMLTLDADGDGVIDRTADNLNTLFDLSRNDVRFGMGPNGEMYITSKGTGELYVVTNSLPVPEPGSLALIGLGGLMLCRRRQNV
ncbi:MAG: PQQ-dependent sugar dehydrogenase, partial [Pseudomonadota bacterium]